MSSLSIYGEIFFNIFSITKSFFLVLNTTNILYNIPDNGVNGASEPVVVDNGVLTSLIWVLFFAYLGLSAYMLYVNFSERENLKRVLLFCDAESATHTTTKVVHRYL